MHWRRGRAARRNAVRLWRGSGAAGRGGARRGEPRRRTGGPACQAEAGANLLQIADGIGRSMVQRRSVLPGQRRLPGLPEDQPRYERTWPIAPRDRLPTIDIPHPDGKINAGVQLCREIRFPEQWQYLAAAGAQLFVYLTNTANTREPEGVWRSHLINGLPRTSASSRLPTSPISTNTAPAWWCHREAKCSANFLAGAPTFCGTPSTLTRPEAGTSGSAARTCSPWHTTEPIYPRRNPHGLRGGTACPDLKHVRTPRPAAAGYAP